MRPREETYNEQVALYGLPSVDQRDASVFASLSRAQFETRDNRHFSCAFVGVPREFWFPVLSE